MITASIINVILTDRREKMIDKKDQKVYEINKHIYRRLDRETAEKLNVREAPESEYLDISHLVDDKFVSFFTDPDSDCKGKTTGYLGSWNYPEIMNSFSFFVKEALCAVYNYDFDMSMYIYMTGQDTIWQKMREKYFNGKPYVQPEEMIEHLGEFDNKETISFLHYCACYSEQFCDGAYGDYAKEGYIGKLLLRLKEFSAYAEK